MTKHRLRLWILLSWALAGTAAGAAEAAVVIEASTTQRLQMRQARNRMQDLKYRLLVDSLRMKTTVADRQALQQKVDVIFRGDQDRLVMVDHDRQSFMVMDADALRELRESLAGPLQQMMKQLEGLDPEQRRRLEEVMGGGEPATGRSPGPRREVRRAKERATHAGYDCVRYDVFEDGVKVRELWLTPWSGVPGHQEVQAAFEALSAFHRDIVGAAGLPRNLLPYDDPFLGLRDLEGFPVVTRDFEDGVLESETILESVVERDLDPDAFEPPAGYRLRSMGPHLTGAGR